MKRVFLSLAIFLVAAASRTDASCTIPWAITSHVEPGFDYSHVYTPGEWCGAYPCPTTSVSPSFRGSFWAMGAGDPQIDVGIDSGAWPALESGGIPDGSGWITYWPGYPVFLDGTWAADPRIDGCIGDVTDPPFLDGTECTGVLLTDRPQYDPWDPAWDPAYFAVLTARVDENGRFDFSRDGNAPIELAEIPPPTSLGGPLSELPIQPPFLPPEALYLDEDCPDPIAGYRIWFQWTVLPEGLLPWQIAEGGAGPDGEPIPLGEGAVISVPVCGSQRRIALTIVTESGFETDLSRATWIETGGLWIDNDCDGSPGYSISEYPPWDCDDGDPTVYHGAAQICDGINNDCEHPSWPDLDDTNEADDDGDGFAECDGDCDDLRPSTRPDTLELCNGLDDDCDDLTDENADGLDFDEDGVPGACDNCPALANDGQEDFDADGIGDLCDNCPLDPDPSQHDADGDLEGDRCDLDDGSIYVVDVGRDELAWQEESGFVSWNVYRGDLDVLRTTGVYTQATGSNPLAAGTCAHPVAWIDDDAVLAPGQTAFYLVTGTDPSGAEGSLGPDGHGTPRPNDHACP